MRGIFDNLFLLVWPLTAGLLTYAAWLIWTDGVSRAPETKAFVFGLAAVNLAFVVVYMAKKERV